MARRFCQRIKGDRLADRREIGIMEAMGRAGLRGRRTLITGPRDSGKTRAASAFVQAQAASGLRVAGVISEACLRDGLKASYAYRDVLTGETAAYAALREGARLPGAPAYAFDEAGLAFGRAAIMRALGPGVGALVVDEIGPLELGGGGLWPAVHAAARAFEGTVVLTVRPSLVAALVAALGWDPDGVTVVDAGAER